MTRKIVRAKDPWKKSKSFSRLLNNQVLKSCQKVYKHIDVLLDFHDISKPNELYINYQELKNIYQLLPIHKRRHQDSSAMMTDYTSQDSSAMMTDYTCQRPLDSRAMMTDYTSQDSRAMMTDYTCQRPLDSSAMMTDYTCQDSSAMMTDYTCQRPLDSRAMMTDYTSQDSRAMMTDYTCQRPLDSSAMMTLETILFENHEKFMIYYERNHPQHRHSRQVAFQTRSIDKIKQDLYNLFNKIFKDQQETLIPISKKSIDSFKSKISVLIKNIHHFEIIKNLLNDVLTIIRNFLENGIRFLVIIYVRFLCIDHAYNKAILDLIISKTNKNTFLNNLISIILYSLKKYDKNDIKTILNIVKNDLNLFKYLSSNQLIFNDIYESLHERIGLSSRQLREPLGFQRFLLDSGFTSTGFIPSGYTSTKFQQI